MAVVTWPIKMNGQTIKKKFFVDNYYTQERVDRLVASMVAKYGPVKGPEKAQKAIDEYDLHKGIYQMRRYDSGRVNVKEKFYYPGSVNPFTPSPSQLACRSKFSDGVLAWQNLTQEQKNGYNEIGKKFVLPGFNYFLRQYLKS